MKTYNVQIIPCVFDRSGVYEYFEISSLSHLPSSIVEEGSLKATRVSADADNIEDALCRAYSYIRTDLQTRLPTQFFVICYAVTLGYFYGQSYREREFNVWISRSARMDFLKKNRSYLTEEQMIHICANPILATTRYLNYDSSDENYSVNTSGFGASF